MPMEITVGHLNSSQIVNFIYSVCILYLWKSIWGSPSATNPTLR